MVSEATGGAVTVEVYAADQLTSGNQTEGIQGVMDGTIELSAHSNIIYSNFDKRLNVVSLPFLFDSFEDVDAKLDGDAGKAVGEVVEACTCWASRRTASVIPPTASVPSSPLPICRA